MLTSIFVILCNFFLNEANLVQVLLFIEVYHPDNPNFRLLRNKNHRSFSVKIFDFTKVLQIITKIMLGSSLPSVVCRRTHVVFTLFVFAFVQTNRIKKVDSSAKNDFINYNVVVNKIRPAVLLLHKRGIA